MGRITSRQLQWLVDQLEEESEDDRDYYIDGPTLDMLQEAGADPALILTLRSALGSREGMETRWAGRTGCGVEVHYRCEVRGARCADSLPPWCGRVRVWSLRRASCGSVF